MKLSTKKFGSIATAAVLAGTMAFMPVAAIADDATGTPEHYGTSQTIEKDYNYGNTPLVAQDFTFSLTYNPNDPNSAKQVGTNSTARPTLQTGKNGKITITTPASDSTPDDKKVSNTAPLKDLVDQYQFTMPGEYTFELSEDAGTNPNISYDTNTKYTVQVNVVWDEDNVGKTVHIDGIFLKDANGKTDKATFKNNSNAASDPLKVEKSVSGTAANLNDYFQYTLKLTKPSQVSGTYNIVNQNGTTVATLSPDSPDVYTATFYLKSGDYVTVTGLPVGTDYTVTESNKVVTGSDGSQSVAADAEPNGYTASNTVDGKTSDDGLVATGNIKKTGNQVEYSNTKGFIPGTGITMNTLPFAVVATVAVAGGAALVISRRRHAGEDF